jgi:hypothetical protein
MPSIVSASLEDKIAAAEEIQTQEFDFSSGSFVMFPISALAKIVQVSIKVSTPFDDPLATIKVGDSGDLSRLMPTNKNSLGESGAYQTFPVYEYSVGTDIIVTVSPGVSTVGSGYITLIHNSNN